MDEQLEAEVKRFYHTLFYEEGWGKMRISLEKTREEVSGVVRFLNPTPGSHFLDWCGGWGRHSIELAKLGYRVTLLDFTPGHIRMAGEAAKEVGVELELVEADFRKTPSEIQADYAVNLFTAGIGHLTEEDDLAALSSLYAALKPGAKFLIDTINLFWLVRNYLPEDRKVSEDGSLTVLDRRSFDFRTNRNSSETTYVRRDGSRETCGFSHRIYSPAELERVLVQAGFKVAEMYGDFDGQPVGFDSRRILVVCEK